MEVTQFMLRPVIMAGLFFTASNQEPKCSVRQSEYRTVIVIRMITLLNKDDEEGVCERSCVSSTSRKFVSVSRLDAVYTVRTTTNLLPLAWISGFLGQHLVLTPTLLNPPGEQFKRLKG